MVILSYEEINKISPAVYDMA